MLKKSSTVGKFESFHKGHQKLIKEAKKNGYICDVISIWRNNPNSLFTLKERKHLAGILKVNLINIPFNSIKNLNPFQFFKLLAAHNYKKLVIGTDWKFGKNRSGNILTAKKLGNLFKIEVVTVEPETVNGRKISTSWIKKLLKEGNLEKAKELLGFNYFVIGKQIKGLGLGKKLGFPTINLELEKLLPIPHGVYQVKVNLNNKEFTGVANFGIKPTVTNSRKETLEIHVIDQKLEKIPEEIKVDFIKFIRPEKKFSSLEELKNQIKLDINKIKTGGNFERNSF